MAFLMTDMAAGSTAARNLQQNIYGAQYDQANIAAAAEQMQQKTQEGNIKLEQDKLNVEKTKLANLVADTGFKASEASKQKLRELAETDEFKKATDAEKLRLSAAVQFKNADIENGVKTLTAAELYDSRELANKQKTLDQNAQQMGNAFAVVDALKTPEQRTAFFKEMETQQPEQYQNLIKQIGPSTFEKMDADERHGALKGLMNNAKGQLSSQLKQIEIQKAEILAKSRERIEQIRQDGALNRKLTGGSDREMRDWNLYNKASENIDRSGKKILEELNKTVDAADAAQEKSKVGLLWNSSQPSEKTAIDYRKAVEARDKFQREQIKKQLNLATTAPDFPGKAAIVDNLKKELELFPEPEAPKASKEEKPEAKPAAKAETPTAVPTKPADTSNKPTSKLILPPKEVIDKANEAIQKGADPKEVFKRLKEKGYNVELTTEKPK